MMAPLSNHSTRHPEVAAPAALEGRRPGSFEARKSAHLRMTRTTMRPRNLEN
jgi:hypothetical protein